MSNLSKYSVDYLLPDTVSKKSKIVYQANNSIKISEISDMNNVVNGIHVLINTTILDVGQNVSQDDINYLKSKVVEDIMTDFRNLTLLDIKLAFQYGSRGDYGQYFGLNRITFYNWIKEYKNTTLREVYQEVIPLLKPKNEIVISQEEIDYGLAKNICSAYFRLVTDGVYEFNDFGNIHFNLLERLDLIQLTEIQIQEINKIAINNVRSNLVSENSDLEKRGKSYHKIDISTAIRNIEDKSDDKLNSRIDIEIKKLKLYQCLYNYASDETDLFELLKLSLKKMYNETRIS